jgi:hypothetical protein
MVVVAPEPTHAELRICLAGLFQQPARGASPNDPSMFWQPVGRIGAL